MPDIDIVKIKTRRGTDDQRKSVIFDQGEIASTTDTKRLFLGTGSLSGGVVIGNKIHNPLLNVYSLSSLRAEVGDLVYCNNTIYQLSSNDYTNLSNWINIGTKINSSYFNFDNTNTLNISNSSIDSILLKPSTINNGLAIQSGILSLIYDPLYYNIVDNALTPRIEGISALQISPNTFEKGLTGGGYQKIKLNVDPSYFYFDGNMLSLSATPSNGVVFADLSSGWFGAGLNYDFGSEKIKTVLTDVDGITLSKGLTGDIYINPSLIGSGLILNGGTLSSNITSIANNTLIRDLSGGIRLNSSMFGSGLVYNSTTPTLSTVLTNVDNVSLSSNASGVISLPKIGLSAVNNWPQITVDEYGIIKQNKSSILDVLAGDSSLSSYNSENSLSALFNGDSLGLSSMQITNFTALSSDGTTIINLSSAGFITFEGNTTTRNGSTIGRFAIPIFRY
jgi:hypothetical protein